MPQRDVGLMGTTYVSTSAVKLQLLVLGLEFVLAFYVPGVSSQVCHASPLSQRLMIASGAPPSLLVVYGSSILAFRYC